MARKLSDLAQDLSMGSPAQARESLFALLGKGGAAAASLRQIASDPPSRKRAVAALESVPVRTLAVLARAAGTAREVLTGLLQDASPEVLVRGWFAAMSSGDEPGPPELAVAVIDWLPGLSARLKPGSPAAALATATLGFAHLRSGRGQLGPDLLREALRTVNLPDSARPVTATALGHAALAAGRHDDVAEAILALAATGSGQIDPAAKLLADMLLVQRPGAAVQTELAVLLDLLPEMPSADRGAAATYLGKAWEYAQGESTGRSGRRQGYFAGELHRLALATQQIVAMFDEPETAMLDAERISAACAAIARRLSGLMSDLVAYQPLSFEPVAVRGLILEVATVWKDELGQSGLRMSCAPSRPEPATLPMLDAAMVKGSLRQLLRHLAQSAASLRAPSPLEAGGASRGARGPASESASESGGGGPQLELDADYELADDLPQAGTITLRLAWPGTAGGPVLAKALDDGTIPDILSRTQATTSISEPGPGQAQLVLRYPAVDPAAQMNGAGSGHTNGRVVQGGDAAKLMAAALAGGIDSHQRAGLALGAFWQLRQAELESWGEDLALVLHDLKNSVAFVSGWLRQGDVYDPTTIRERCLDNISDVQFWLAQAGGTLARSPGAARPWVHLPELTRRILRSLAAVIAHRHQRLSLDIDDSVPRVPAEPIWVASVLRNLAKNAVEAMPDGGELHVTVRHEHKAGAVVVEFKDEGPGFPPELLSQDGQSGSATDGLSRPHLGLASVRRILAEQGGRLELRNEGGATAQARFDAGRGDADLAELLPQWTQLREDTRRALTAGRALLAAGDHETAGHLWGKALQVELAALTGELTGHELAPWAIPLAEGSSVRPSLSALTRQNLNSVAGPSEQARAEAAARRLLGRVLGGKPRLDDLGPDEIAAALVLFRDRPPMARLGSRDALVQLARILWRASAGLEAAQLRADPSQAQANVIAAIQQITDLSLHQLGSE